MTEEARRHWDAPLFPYFSVELDSGVFGFLGEMLQAKEKHSKGRYGDAYDDMISRGVKAFQVAREGRVAEIEAAVAPPTVRKVKRRAPAKKR